MITADSESKRNPPLSSGLLELKEACERMAKLLGDPQPGLISWWEAVERVRDEIKERI